MKEIHGNISSRDINKHLGNMWNSFSKVQKNPYVIAARQEKITMQRNMKLLETKLGKKLKKPVCAYSLFV